MIKVGCGSPASIHAQPAFFEVDILLQIPADPRAINLDQWIGENSISRPDLWCVKFLGGGQTPF